MLDRLPKNKLNTIFIVSSILFILFTTVFIINEYILVTKTGYGLLSFELTWMPERTNEILSAWGPEVIDNQLKMHYLDYLYIPFYVLFGISLVLILTRKLHGKIRNIAPMIIAFIILAGVYDAVENINLILILKNQFSCLNPILASLFATLKISFLILSIFFLLIMLTTYLRGINKIKR